jgi:ABC-type transporter Mla subunit MlaD
MMARSGYEKLGLLVLLVIAALVAFGFLLGIRTAPTDTYYTYFDESVQGLETGAFVKYRGVRIGSVGDITIAPDGRHIAVELELDREKSRHFAIGDHAKQLRARLAIIGITGLKLIDLEPANHVPPPVLTFPTPPNYIPARRSLVSDLEGIFERVDDKLPRAIDRAVATLEILEALAVDARHAELPARIANAADRVASIATDLGHTVRRLDQRAGSSAKKLDSILDRIQAPDGLLASARRAMESLGAVGRNAMSSTGDLDRTFRELRDAARAVRGFFNDLSRQPDMIVKGRSR